jgi:chemotaxis protein MotB
MAVSGEQPIVIKKVKKVVGGGHHGGAWKVAYADFVTAMMAFFLLMWLLNTTSPEQKQGIADYFAPASISSTTSGSGGILGGTSLGDDGAKADGKMSVIQQMAPEAPDDVNKEGQSSTTASLDSASEQALRDALAKKEQDSFASAAESLRQSLQDMPELAELSKQIMIDQTPEGLRIQLIDQEGRSMFKENSREPNDRARILLRAVAKVINQLPNRVTVSGHTSANAEGRKSDSDWSLSAARADASRLVLRNAGVDDDRIYQVSGKANSEPLYADDPTLAGNRRISIVLLREKPVLPDGL